MLQRFRCISFLFQPFWKNQIVFFLVICSITVPISKVLRKSKINVVSCWLTSWLHSSYFLKRASPFVWSSWKLEESYRKHIKDFQRTRKSDTYTTSFWLWVFGLVSLVKQKPKEKTANTAEQMYSFLFEFEQ